MTDRPRRSRPRPRPQMLIGGKPVDAADGQTFEVDQPGDRPGHRHRPAGRARGRRPGGRGSAQGVRRPQGLVELGGRQARPDAGQARRAGQGPHRGARPAREPQRRQADHRRAGRDHSASASSSTTTPGAANKVFGQTIPVSQAGPGPHPARADRRGRADRALELPAADGLAGSSGRRWPPATPASSSRPATPR